MKTTNITPSLHANPKTLRLGTELPARPMNTFPISVNPQTLVEWEKAAKRNNARLEDWIKQTLDQASFKINHAKEIEAILDLKAFEKCQRGENVSYEEYERAERYRENNHRVVPFSRGG